MSYTTIEEIVIGHLLTQLNIFVGAEIQLNAPDEYIVVEKTGSQERNHISTATIAIQSYSTSRANAAQLNELVIDAMRSIIERPEVTKCELNGDYNYTDIQRKKHRYQAVFDITYYREV